MDSQAVKAAEEAAERCTDHVNRYWVDVYNGTGTYLFYLLQRQASIISCSRSGLYHCLTFSREETAQRLQFQFPSQTNSPSATSSLNLTCCVHLMSCRYERRHWTSRKYDKRNIQELVSISVKDNTNLVCQRKWPEKASLSLVFLHLRGYKLISPKEDSY